MSKVLCLFLIGILLISCAPKYPVTEITFPPPVIESTSPPPEPKIEIDPETGLVVSARKPGGWTVTTEKDPLTGMVKYWRLQSPDFLPAEIIYESFDGNSEGFIFLTCTPSNVDVPFDGRRISFLAFQSGDRYGQFAFAALYPVEFALGIDKGIPGEFGNVLFESQDDSWVNPGRLLSVMVKTKETEAWSARMVYRMRLTDRDLAEVRRFKGKYCGAT